MATMTERIDERLELSGNAGIVAAIRAPLIALAAEAASSVTGTSLVRLEDLIVDHASQWAIETQ